VPLVATMSPPDTDQLEAVFRRVGPAMHRQALAVLADGPAAEDVVQEAFLRVWRRRAKLAEPDALDGYLLQAVRNLALDTLRWRKRREPQASDRDPDLTVAAPGGDPLEAERVSRALLALPVDQREVVVLRVLEGRTFPEVAARTGAPLGTVHSRFRYALERLRGLLGGA
jgi:RNA polymerase sigma-70 factor, ECF subfamily